MLIVGGGLVGLALLATLLPLGRSVALADRAVPARPALAGAWDTRIYAISPGSVAALEAAGAWSRVPVSRVQPIESMRVFGDAGAVLNFSAYEAGEPALAWIVENAALVAALLDAIDQRSPARAPYLAGATLDRLEPGEDWVTAGFADGRRVRARLVVGADGAASAVRERSGIPAEVRRYGQVSVVANFECERPHRGRAWQWFLADGGVLALLPMPGRRVSLVWSAPDARAEALTAAPGRLAAEVEQTSGGVTGRLVLTEGPLAFPLGIVTVREPCRGRTVLIGDAAHGIHPLAGQGVNLGFGDVAALARALAELPGDPGSGLALARYRLARAEAVAAMQLVTDGLWKLFNNRSAGVREVRNAGMSLLERIPPLKRALMQPALR